jgi:hypothetical protein
MQFLSAWDFFMPKKRRDVFFNARKLLMSMTFARRRFFRLDNPSERCGQIRSPLFTPAPRISQATIRAGGVLI